MLDHAAHVEAIFRTSASSSVLQIPEETGCEKYDFKVVHQIIRELTIGIYVLNQVPNISLEANFDCSTSVQLPPAYIDTKVLLSAL